MVQAVHHSHWLRKGADPQKSEASLTGRVCTFTACPECMMHDYFCLFSEDFRVFSAHKRPIDILKHLLEFIFKWL